MVPSLVTWPTRIRAKPARFARRISSCAEVLTWETVPGADSRLSTYMHWIESMTTTSGASLPSSVAAMSRTDVAAARPTAASAWPSRWARSRSWSMASSPEM